MCTFEKVSNGSMFGKMQLHPVLCKNSISCTGRCIIQLRIVSQCIEQFDEIVSILVTCQAYMSSATFREE